MNDPCECGPCTYTLEDITALGKRLVACKGFRPMRGMLDLQGRTWDASLLWRWNSAIDVPDLRDPATVGCLLALARAAHGAPSVTFEGRTYSSVLHVVYFGGMYYVKRDCGDADEHLYEDGLWSQNYRRDAYSIERASEAEALVAALEAAP